MMILNVGLEMIRRGFNAHTRGILLSSTDGLDHLINMARASLMRDVLKEYIYFADTNKNVITAWNDDAVDKVEVLRSHMLHVETTMTVGHGINVVAKRSWNGYNLEGVKITEKETKRRLRLVKFNDEVEIKFQGPIFDIEKGTYNQEEMDKTKIDALDQPLVPIKRCEAKRVIIK